MIEIAETGRLNSVQDLGRVGFRKYGIARGGAMDRLAAAAANALLGNDLHAAIVELQLFPVRIRFRQAHRFALTGADCDARLDGAPVPPWWSACAREGQELSLGFPTSGARAYLAIAGGIDVPVVLGSRSTQLRDGFGGFQGRELARGDVLAAGAAPCESIESAAGVGIMPPAIALGGAGEAADDRGVVTVRVVPAAECSLFKEDSQEAFWTSTWKVTNKSNRQGYVLRGDAPLVRQRDVEMRSHPLIPGVVQVPPSGHPIIQLTDGNSAGGYPKFGVVIEADLWRLAQARPGSAFRFAPCSVPQAKQATTLVESYLGRVRAMAALCRNPRPA